MKLKDAKIQDARLKNLFAKMDKAKPGDNFTIDIMQKIASEKITIVPKQSNKFIMWLALTLFSIFLLIGGLYLWPDPIWWIQSITINIPQNYITELKNYGNILSVFFSSLYISPAILTILVSSSIMVSIIGITAIRDTIKN